MPRDIAEQPQVCYDKQGAELGVAEACFSLRGERPPHDGCRQSVSSQCFVNLARNGGGAQMLPLGLWRTVCCCSVSLTFRFCLLGRAEIALRTPGYPPYRRRCCSSYTGKGQCVSRPGTYHVPSVRFLISPRPRAQVDSRCFQTGTPCKNNFSRILPRNPFSLGGNQRGLFLVSEYFFRPQGLFSKSCLGAARPGNEA